MRLFQSILGLAVALVAASPLQAASDPLRLIPDKADMCVKLERPREFLELVLHNDLFKQFQALEPVQEYYASTNFRRFTQLISYFEKELGASHLEIIDRLAGDGIVYALQFSSQPVPQLLVFQGRDEAMLRRFIHAARMVTEKELARQESKERIKTGKYRNVETFRIGKNLHMAVAGAALLISSQEGLLHKALDLHLDGGKQNLTQVKTVAEARDLAGKESIAWMWLNLEKVHKAPQAKEVFRLPRNDPQLTVLFGGLLDVAARSSFLCAGLHSSERGFSLSFRMPRGREGMPPALSVHVPAQGPGIRPLLEPKGTLYSASFYLDPAGIWNNRAKLFNEKQVKGMEEFDKQTTQFLAGSPMSKLLLQAGPNQRIVVAHQPKPPYKVAPGQNLPAFALVMELREPEAFGKRMEAIIRSAALLATTQVSLKSVEEKHGQYRIIGYRFPEDGKFALDINNLRFNFTPCFVTVRNQFIASSSMDLCKEMIDLVEKEGKAESQERIPAAFRQRFYASGGVQLIEYYQDRFFTQIILDQAIPPDKAQEQLTSFINLVRQLGYLEMEDVYENKGFRFDLRLQLSGDGRAQGRTSDQKTAESK